MAHKGVNLGGWLVLEKWMTPSLFAHTTQKDEVGLSSEIEYGKIIKQHHRSFVKKSDIRWLSQRGVTHLRVPIGYWIFGDQPPLARGIDYLDNLFEWADEYDMKILLSIHGAPGSQNGKHHSGKIGGVSWKRHQRTLYEFTLAIAQRYSNSTTLWGMCILNEPTPNPRHFWALLRHYHKISRSLKKILPSCNLYVDATFRPLWWTAIAKILRLGIDIHLYHGFGGANYTRAQKRLRRSGLFLQIASRLVPVIVGEWSGVLHTRGTSQQHAHYIGSQQDTYMTAQSNFYWTYKTESGGSWSYKDMHAKKLIK